MGVPGYFKGMFVRRKQNRSGSISVQVVEKSKDRRQVVLKSIGSGRTEDEIQELERRGYDYIDSFQGPMLPGFSEDDNSLENFLSSIVNNQIQVIGPELIFGTIFDRLGYNAIEYPMFRHLVICRLFNPGSKLKTVEYLADYLHITCSVDKIYRFLDELCLRHQNDAQSGIKEQVEQITFEHTKQVVGGKIAVCFYDMTTLYFEAAEEDELRHHGFSKDGKHACPQIFLGLLVTTGGNPIGYDIFEGNTVESRTLIPMIQKLSQKFGLGKPVVIADSGLLTKGNIAALQEKGYEFILGARPKNESQEIKTKILGMALSDGMITEIDKDDGVRLIVSCSAKRALKESHNRKRGLERLQKSLGSGKLTKQNINNRGYNKYLKMDGNVKISIDIEKFNADAAWDGLKGYVTNTSLTAKEVIGNYSNLWGIERAFRFNKSDLAVRPIFHRLRNRIEGHLCICFTACTILLELERMLKQSQTGISIYEARELTRKMYALNCELPKTRQIKRYILRMNERQSMLYNLVTSQK